MLRGGHHPDRRRHQQPRAAVDVLAREGRELVEKILIDELKIPFARSGRPSELDYAQEAGHSRRRILHVKDTTGRTIEENFVGRSQGAYRTSPFFPATPPSIF